MQKRNEKVREVIGVLVFGLLITWIFLSPPPEIDPDPEKEGIKVNVKDSTYTALPDSTLEVRLEDSSKLHIEYKQLNN